MNQPYPLGVGVLFLILKGLSITCDFIAQSKFLGGSTPQTPRWGRGAAPKPPAH
ncbi:hypothetical protein C789_2910 [Microcystis aeruginosa FACHB-905 = DIANCHI905]|uniref:Mobile element protein n=1 Tax=Microcystis aeruginosa PCC 7806SL TaxID=1903187 RepID=A0AB33BWK9_MICA7|nr:hypothetical protein BH695_5081 [Microcystis aeruginosa PCC 7806SL]ELS47311.1 hypothetical protein C789_2910 [Microcystis aeruginosa FACHB-905 = DIANCHI905]